MTVSANGSGVLTDDYSLTCFVLFTEGFIGFTNNITLEKMTDNSYEVLDYSTTISSITVDLSPLTTTDTGTYKCSFNTIQDAISYERTFEDLTNITITSKIARIIMCIFCYFCPSSYADSFKMSSLLLNLYSLYSPSCCCSSLY